MKIAIISDIHSNLEALKEVFKIIDKKIKPDKIINLGDTIGYGPNPADCTELIRKREIPSILGNHEAAVCKLISSENFNPYARQAVDWTRDQLSSKQIEYLGKLTDKIIFDDVGIMFIHGALTERFNYILNSIDARQNMQILRESYPKINVCFFGHSHVKTVCADESIQRVDEENFEMKISEEKKYLINPGSVGQPRGGITTDACFAVMDTEEMFIKYYEVPYDKEKTYKKIVNSGLPGYLAERLLRGV